MQNCSICINLIGILYEKKKNFFKIIHSDLPDLLSKKANDFKIEKFIHLSALGIETAKESSYASSKLQGEDKIKKNFKNYIILRPSIVYSVDDNFTTQFMSLINKLPIIPLYYNGGTKFSPIHVIDLVNIIHKMIDSRYKQLTLECVGPEELSFKEILQNLLLSIDKKRILLPLPYQIAKLSAKILQLFPKPLLTEDQLKLLRYDNCISGKYKNNFDIGLESVREFKNEIDKYSYNWRTGGQFANKNNVN